MADVTTKSGLRVERRDAQMRDWSYRSSWINDVMFCSEEIGAISLKGVKGGKHISVESICVNINLA